LKDNDTENKWNEFKVPTNKPSIWNIGTLNVFYKKIKNEFWLYHSYDKNQSENTDPKDLSWSRYSLKSAPEKIVFKPLMPDRPIVVMPEYPFQIVSGGQAKIFIRVPLWVKIEVNEPKDTKISEIPSVVLSNTWFGNFAGGDLCYWISSSARIDAIEDIERSYLAICPISFYNQSDDYVKIEKLCLRVIGQSLYNHHGHIWADETKVIYEGKSDESEIEFTGKKPKEIPDGILITKPRKQYKKSVHAKFFSEILGI
jgi:hypothetical protein